VIRGALWQRGASWRPFVFAPQAMRMMMIALSAIFSLVSPVLSREPVLSRDNSEPATTPPPRASGTLRIATYNVSFFGKAEGDLTRELVTPESVQPKRIAAVLQRVRPNILLLNEFDYDPRSPELFARNYLAISQAGGKPLRFAHHFIAPSNTGIPSGFDLDRSGSIGGGNDALGFGQFSGQYGLVVFSQLPIDNTTTRTFRHFLWRDMPSALLPPDWYTPESLAKLSLSSKSHWDVAIRLSRKEILHFLVSHPTPPGFDGPEDRNGRRNHDEIRLWADYIDPSRSDYLRDDRGRQGGLEAGASFVIAGDLNADPQDGGSVRGAIDQLLLHPRVNRETAIGDLAPRSRGASEAALRQGGANAAQRGDASLDTADFSDRGNGVGNLRTDYVLPSSNLEVCASGVFWPASTDAEFALVNDDVEASSDHRLVWVDIALSGRRCPIRSK